MKSALSTHTHTQHTHTHTHTHTQRHTQKNEGIGPALHDVANVSHHPIRNEVRTQKKTRKKNKRTSTRQTESNSITRPRPTNGAVKPESHRRRGFFFVCVCVCVRRLFYCRRKTITRRAQKNLVERSSAGTRSLVRSNSRTIPSTPITRRHTNR